MGLGGISANIDMDAQFLAGVWGRSLIGDMAAHFLAGVWGRSPHRELGRGKMSKDA